MPKYGRERQISPFLAHNLSKYQYFWMKPLLYNSNSSENMDTSNLSDDIEGESDYDPVLLIRRQFLNAVIQIEAKDDDDSDSPDSQSPTTSQTYANLNVQTQSGW